jgi:hypothetical protein
VLSIVSAQCPKGTTVSESALKKIAEDCDLFLYDGFDSNSKFVFRPISNVPEFLSSGKRKEIVFFHKNKESNSKGVSLYLNGNNVIESVGEFKY